MIEQVGSDMARPHGLDSHSNGKHVLDVPYHFIIVVINRQVNSDCLDMLVRVDKLNGKHRGRPCSARRPDSYTVDSHDEDTARACFLLALAVQYSIMNTKQSAKQAFGYSKPAS